MSLTHPFTCARALLLTPGALCLLAIAGCGADASTDRPAVSVDTLAGGAVRVANGADGVWDSASTWRIVEDLRIGTAEGDGPAVFGLIYGLAVDEYGRIYVLDGQLQAVQVFGADGSHVRTIGRKGAGPGEFGNAIGMGWGPGGRLWVVDPGNGRYAVFDTTGRYLEQHLRTLGFYQVPWPGGFDAAGRLHDNVARFEGTGAPKGALVRYRLDLQSADTFWLPDFEPEVYQVVTDQGRSRATAPVPFSPNLEWTLGPEGHLWYGVSDRYRIVEATLEGDTLRIIEKEWEPLPVTEEDRREVVERLREFADRVGLTIDESRVPATKPAFTSLFVDEAGRLWVRPSFEPDGARTLDVFDEAGRYLGAVRLEVDLALLPPVLVHEEAVYSTAADELGVPYVVRARIVR